MFPLFGYLKAKTELNKTEKQVVSIRTRSKRPRFTNTEGFDIDGSTNSYYISRECFKIYKEIIGSIFKDYPWQNIHFTSEELTSRSTELLKGDNFSFNTPNVLYEWLNEKNNFIYQITQPNGSYSCLDHKKHNINCQCVTDFTNFSNLCSYQLDIEPSIIRFSNTDLDGISLESRDILDKKGKEMHKLYIEKQHYIWYEYDNQYLKTFLFLLGKFVKVLMNEQEVYLTLFLLKWHFVKKSFSIIHLIMVCFLTDSEIFTHESATYGFKNTEKASSEKLLTIKDLPYEMIAHISSFLLGDDLSKENYLIYGNSHYFRNTYNYADIKNNIIQNMNYCEPGFHPLNLNILTPNIKKSTSFSYSYSMDWVSGYTVSNSYSQISCAGCKKIILHGTSIYHVSPSINIFNTTLEYLKTVKTCSFECCKIILKQLVQAKPKITVTEFIDNRFLYVFDSDSKSFHNDQISMLTETGLMKFNKSEQSGYQTGIATRYGIKLFEVFMKNYGLILSILKYNAHYLNIKKFDIINLKNVISGANFMNIILTLPQSAMPPLGSPLQPQRSAINCNYEIADKYGSTLELYLIYLLRFIKENTKIENVSKDYCIHLLKILDPNNIRTMDFFQASVTGKLEYFDIENSAIYENVLRKNYGFFLNAEKYEIPFFCFCGWCQTTEYTKVIGTYNVLYCDNCCRILCILGKGIHIQKIINSIYNANIKFEEVKKNNPNHPFYPLVNKNKVQVKYLFY